MSQQQRADETRERILRVSLDLFTRQGYDATGVAEICAAAGVSKGAFYHHFQSKQAAFVALLEQWLAGLDRLSAAASGGASAPERLSAMAGMFEQATATAAGQLPMFLEFWRQAAKEPEVWQKTIEPYRRFRGMFSEIIAGGVAEGSLRPVDPDLAGEMLVALGVGLILQGALDSSGTDWGKAGRASVDILLEGLRRRE